MEYCGYAGNILYVNLTTGNFWKESLDPEWIGKFLGGWGINYRLAWDLIKPDVEPLSPESPIIIGAGPLVGTMVPGAAKIQATVKFPLPTTLDGKSCVASACSGSERFGYQLKNAGYDHVVITGRAKTPVYLKIIDDDVEICDASEFWGQNDIYETTDKLIDRYEGCGVIAIGKAGENLVPFSMALTDKRSTLGRHGFGAVMGSKNLKAIVVIGAKGIRVKDSNRFMQAIDSLYSRVAKLPFMRPQHDSGIHHSWPIMLVHNLNPGRWSKVKWTNLYGIEKWYEVKKDVKSCTSCWIGCRVDYRIEDGEFAGLEPLTIQYSAVGVLGQLLDLKDHRQALALAHMLNRDGLCYLQTTGLVDWVTRLYEQGVITKKDTDGLVLKRDYDTYARLFNQIANKEGFGSYLAQGIFDIEKHLGQNARTGDFDGFGFAKGIITIYPGRARTLDPMGFTMGISNPRPGHSPQGHSFTTTPLQPIKGIRTDAELWGTSQDALDRIFQPVAYYGAFNVARLTRHLEDFYSVVMSLGTCTVYSASILLNSGHLAEFYSAVTGFETSPEELKTLGERNYNLYKLLNVRQGFTRKDDQFPEVWLKPLDTPDGRQWLTDYYHIKRINEEDIHKLLDDYYDERGWDLEKGVPTIPTLHRLGLEEFVKT